MTQLILFTDIDGVLVQAGDENQSDAIQQAMAHINQRDIPIVLCSGRTKAAQKPVRKALGIDAPYIVENGSAIVIPGTSPIAYSHIGRRTQILKLGITIDEIHERLDAIRDETDLKFSGTMHMETRQVAERLGVPEDIAAQFQKREYSETILTHFTADDAVTFQQACEQHDLHCVAGGRYFTVTGASVDKGQAVAMLIKQFKAHYGSIRTVAIGNTPTDSTMLATVDDAYFISQTDNSANGISPEDARLLDVIEVRDFREAIEHLLND